MKKTKILIRLCLLTVSILLFAQVSTFAATGTSTGAGVRVRKSASSDSEQIEVLAVNDRVEILGEEGDWYKISFKDKTGYVSKAFIETGSKKTTTSESTEKKEEQATEPESNTAAEQPAETSEASANQGAEEITETPQENNKVEENTTEAENNTNNNAEQTTQEQPAEQAQATVAVPASNTKKCKITSDTVVNILPVITSEQISQVKKNQEVNLITSTGLWGYVKAENIDGWVRIDKLTVIEEANATEQEQSNSENTEKTEQPEEQKNQEEPKVEENQEQAANNTSKTMYSSASSVNVRSQANTSSDAVASIPLNTEVKVVGEENGWYKIEFNGKSGYVRADLLSDNKTEVTSRSNTLDRTAALVAENSVQEISVKVPEQTTENTQAATSTTAQQQSSTETKQATQTTKNAQATQTTQQTQVAQTATTNSSSVTGTDIANYAKTFVGCRYVYGAAGPSSFDCSGLVMYVYKHFGYSLSHSSKVQATQGKAVTGELQPGDILVFSNNGKTVGHVGIYIGNDKFVHASDSSTGVIISNLSAKCNKSKYWGARRIL